MALVRPDMLTTKSEEPNKVEPPTQVPDAQNAFYDSQLTRERLSPDASLIQILTHLQKAAHHVLNDNTLKSHDKLQHYNQLMVKSSILMNKAKAKGRPHAYTQGPKQSTSKVTAAEDSDDYESDTETVGLEEESETEDEFLDTASSFSTPRRPLSPTLDREETGPLTRRTLSHMDTSIRRQVPATYQKNAMNLYRLIAEKGKGRGVNWTESGELVVKGHVVKGSNMIELLTDASRKTGRVRPPVGQHLFVSAVKRLNPELKYIRNKTVFNTGGRRQSITARRRTLSVSPGGRKRFSQQTGSGRRPVITWRTRL
jgi:hypothetical protein